MTLLFVHGTGVRRASYEISLAQVREAVEKEGLGLHVLDCLWGEAFGARLHENGTSVPTYEDTREAGGIDVEDVPDKGLLLALWDLLYDDPLYELRTLAASAAHATPSLSPNADLDAQPVLRTKLRELSESVVSDERFGRTLVAGGLVDSFAEACHIIVQSSAFSDFTMQSQMHSTEPTARAVVAMAIALAESSNGLGGCRAGVDSALRDEIIMMTMNLLGTERGVFMGTSSGVANVVARPLIGLGRLALFHGISHYGQRKRGAVTDAAYPAAADILLYQARGELIRSFIRQRLASATAPLYLLAHSLGGVACFDVLVASEFPQVEMLITVGSQAPFFYEVGALQSIQYRKCSPDERLPSHFPKWMNFYDRRDFLSYVGEGIFGCRVKDIAVDNGQPFPRSHSAYWSNETLWKEIAACIHRR